MFVDRTDAGRRLAGELRHLRGEDPIVLALPRGGVPVAYEVARALDAPLDLLLIRKIGAPGQPELALGAVMDGDRPETVINEEGRRLFAVTDEELAELVAAKLAEIEQRRQRYLAGRPRARLDGRTVIVVDDGVATGATMRVALKAIRRAGPRRLVVAVPVAPPDAVEVLKRDADEVVCLDASDFFGGISAFYGDFRQLDDADVVALLNRARRPEADDAGGTERA
ncbi:MAG TPA: phosphoribosyltransferase family protein [Dongiaceae bacterium]|nr:phosphoribosyltransferase family protein [Dongiaceae bacterium]